MARNLGHVRADDKANETKNVSHNTLNYKDYYAPINVKPRGFDCEVCPQGRDFYFDCTRYLQGGEFEMTTILDNEEDLEINL